MLMRNLQVSTDQKCNTSIATYSSMLMNCASLPIKNGAAKCVLVLKRNLSCSGRTLCPPTQVSHVWRGPQQQVK